MTWNDAIKNMLNHIAVGYSKMYPGESFQAKEWFCDEGYSAVKSDYPSGSLNDEFGRDICSIWESDQVNIYPLCQDLAYSLICNAILTTCKSFPVDGAVNDINQWPLYKEDFQSRIFYNLRKLYDE